MASPRSPSPSASEASSPPSTPLTPRSKLKALYATIDDGSDDSDAAGSPARKEIKAVPITAVSSTTNLETEEASDDDEEVVRPRGRLASRMQANDKSEHEQGVGDGKDARERVKQLLQTSEARASGPGMTSDVDKAGGDDNDEDDAIITRPRKLKNRTRRSKTPESTPSQRQESPAIFVTPSKEMSPREDSPGMFVTPNKETSPRPRAGSDGSGSDNDLPAEPLRNERFLVLVAKKRAQRLAKEAEEESKRAARAAVQEAAEQDLAGDDDSDITDDEGGRKLTQEGRPARKASRKALEEMNRETQRMNRSLQLAHEAKTKKKITKASLFERFNFKPQGMQVDEQQPSGSSRPATPVSARHTDTEMRDGYTPPSSPPTLGKTRNQAKPTSATVQDAPSRQGALAQEEEHDALLSLDDVLQAASKSVDKGKGKATTADLEGPPEDKKRSTARRVRVKLPIHASLAAVDPDDELVITETKTSRLDAIFDRIPVKREKESRAMFAFRQLAQLRSPGKEAVRGKGKTALSSAQLQANLQQRARAQAKLERDRRLDMLKAKGVHIQTEEEREKERVEVEDIVARARLEAEEIMQREREEVKKEKKEKRKNGEIDPLAWDDSDESWDEDEEREHPAEVELSGSEDEGVTEEDDEASDKDSAAGNLFDNEAESADESEDQEAEIPDDKVPNAESDDEMMDLPVKTARRTKKQVTIISDDEDEEDDLVAKTPKPKATLFKSPSVQHNSDSPQIPTSVLRSATKAFIPGLPVANGGPAGLGLTQIFAGTMDNSQTSDFAGSPSQPMPTFDHFPDSNISQNAVEQPDDMVLDSQPTQTAAASQQQDSESQGLIQLHYSQSQTHGLDSLLRDNDNATQMSEQIALTQDGGYQNFTPLKERFIEAPPSTIATVVVDPSQGEPSQHDSPLLQRRGKLRRKVVSLVESDQDDENNEVEEEGVDEDEIEPSLDSTTAFSVMKDAALQEQKLKAIDAFNKKKSKARAMVEEQAEESEDEYAGLGGVDGEDSDDSAGSVHEMIDDDHKSNVVDDAKLAAFFADRERANDEKQVEKLFKDLTSGMLRRKRGADYDLSDSDDGGEARKRLKRRQFAKMQKALFADERISKVAENPRNQAFLRTIEDHGSDDDMDFIFAAPPAPQSEADSQPAGSQDVAIPDSQPVPVQAQVHAAPRLPAAQRRTAAGGKRPANIGEIRESLSTLLDDVHNAAVIIPATDATAGSESDDDADDEGGSKQRRRSPGSKANSPNKENRHPRRGRHAVVDRISLKRAGSSASTSSTSLSRVMAFAVPGGGGSFKVPALLRRATTNSLVSSSSGGSGGGAAGGKGATGGGGFGEEGKIKKGAGKRSGVNYFARENERRAAVAENEKRREAKKIKGAKGRGMAVGGLFGAGKFE